MEKRHAHVDQLVLLIPLAETKLGQQLAGFHEVTGVLKNPGIVESATPHRNACTSGFLKHMLGSFW